MAAVCGQPKDYSFCLNLLIVLSGFRPSSVRIPFSEKAESFVTVPMATPTDVDSQLCHSVVLLEQSGGVGRIC